MDEEVQFASYETVNKLFFDYLNGDVSSCPKTGPPIQLDKNALEQNHDNDNGDYRNIIYDAYYSCIFEEIPPEKVSALIPQFFANVKRMPTFCVSLLATFDILTTIDDSARQRFISLAIQTSRFFPTEIFTELIDPETLEQCGIIKSAKLLNQKVVRLKTKLFYKQKKFNLLREESEGYSKILVSFRTINSLKGTPEESILFVNRISCVIGCFSLDPYRVLDLLLDYMSFTLPDPNICGEILNHFQSMTGPCLKEIITYKIASKSINKGFFSLIALLVRKELLDLHYIYEHLTPSDDDFTKKLEILSKNDEVLIKKASSITLQESYKSSRQLNQVYRFPECYKMSLLAAFILTADFHHIDFFTSRIPIKLFVVFPDVLKSLITVLHMLIEPLYSKLGYRLINKESSTFHEFSCKNSADLNPIVFRFLKFLGPHIYEDALLLVKLIRIFAWIMRDIKNDQHELKKGITMAICTCFLPALTQLECNCVVSEELWLLIRLFPCHVRYRFYGYIKSTAYSERVLSRTKVIMIKNVKYICKRITKDTVKQCGRQLGKLSHSNPIIVLSEVVNLVCSFDSMITSIVECLKYLTPLSYDVLAFTIIEFLSANSVTLTAKITSIPAVIQSIGTFTSAVMRKYPVPMMGVLQYIANQLKDSNPLDLIVLREILHKMSGIEENHLSSRQMDILAGSENLQDESGVGLLSKSLKKYALRLRDSLVEANLIFPLYFMTCQQRDRLVYDKKLSGIHIKLTGQLFDECHKTLVQYGRFISRFVPVSDFSKSLPTSFLALNNQYGLSLECIFFLIRHIFRNELLNTPKNVSFIQVVNDLLQPYVQLLSELIPQKNQQIPFSLVCAFWLCDIYDIFLPSYSYQDYINKCNQTLSMYEESNNNQSRKSKEKERLSNVVQALVRDQDEQKMHVAYIGQWLFAVLSDSSIKYNKHEFLNTFFQLCVYPRSTFSSTDAIYTSHFIFVLHNLRSPNFNSLSLLDKIFCESVHIIASLSESEAYNYGIFINKIWEFLEPWHISNTVFDQNCSKHPGFSIMSRSDQDKTEDHEYENFRHLMYKWHYKQTKSFIFCLESKDYIQIRNSIIILTRVSSTFPRVLSLKNAIEKRIEKLVDEEKDKRPDLYVLVTCYSGILRNMKDSLVEEAEFHHKDPHKDDKTQQKDGDVVRQTVVHTQNRSIEHVAESKPPVIDYVARQEIPCVPITHSISAVDAKTRASSDKPPEESQSAVTERTYSLRNSDRKRSNEEHEETRTKRRKEADNHGNTTNTHTDPTISKKGTPFSNPTPELENRNPLPKTRSEAYLTRRKSRENDYPPKRELKKRRV